MSKSQILIIIGVLPFYWAQTQTSPFLLARAFEIRNMPDSAILYYNLCIEKEPRNIKALNARGNYYYTKKDWPKAIADFEEAEKIRNGTASYPLAKIYAHLKDTQKTISYLEKHLSSYYKLPASEIRGEKVFGFLERTSQWRKLWEKNWYNRLDEQTGEARYMLESADWMGVINFITENTKNQSNNTELLAIRAKAYLELGNIKTAITDLDRAIEKSKNNAELFKYRGNAYLTIKEFRKAEADFSKAIALTPDDFSLYLSRSSCFAATNQYAQAFSDINLLVSLFPDNQEYLYQYAYILFLAGKFITALPAVNKLISEKPLVAKYYLLRGKIYYGSQTTNQAVKDFDSCIAIEPGNAEALKLRGIIRFKNNDTKNACIDWLKAEKAGDIEAGRLRFENCR